MKFVDCTRFAGTLSLLAAATAASFTGGCQRPAPAQAAKAPATVVTAPSTMASAQPAAAPALVEYVDQGAHIQYQNTWVPKKDPNFHLRLVPVAGTPDCAILFDIPDLPPHFPGMIRIGLVEHGYLSELKKMHAGVHTDSSTDQTLTDSTCKARLVQSGWTENGTNHADVALLIMRNDIVYILSCDADAKNAAATRADFDKVMATLHWGK